jgi:hypothetical protein
MSNIEFLSIADIQLAIVYHMRNCPIPTIVLPMKASLAIEAMWAKIDESNNQIARESLTNEQWLAVLEGLSGARQLDFRLPKQT